MAIPRTTIRGALVGIQTRSYDGFTAEDGKAVPAGERYVLWVQEQFGDAPKDIRVAGSKYELIKDLDDETLFGRMIEVTAWVKAVVRGKFAETQLEIDGKPSLVAAAK